MKLEKCRSCGSKNFEHILNLGETPWCNDFKFDHELKSEKYPLNLVYCKDCHLTQLDYTVEKEIMFSNHTYVSGTTKTLANHFYDIAKYITETYSIKKQDLIVDIGGNDGTNLLQYKKLGFNNLLNVESASNIADISSKNEILTWNCFFNEQFVKEYFLSVRNKKAKIINAAGVFFHLEELHSVIRGIKNLLSHDGVFVVQFMDLYDIVENTAFDAIYHEHLCYYSLESLQNLLDPYSLKIINCRWSPIHAGSMIAEIVHKDNIHDNIIYVFSEYNVDLNDLKKFSKRCFLKKKEIKDFLINLKKQGKKIYGYGSPAKGTTMLNYCEIDNTIIDKLVEINDLKIGRIAPGSNIPIVKESKDDVPDFYYVLSWNFWDEIKEKNKDIIKKGVKFILPLPELRIIG